MKKLFLILLLAMLLTGCETDQTCQDKAAYYGLSRYSTRANWNGTGCEIYAPAYLGQPAQWLPFGTAKKTP